MQNDGVRNWLGEQGIVWGVGVGRLHPQEADFAVEI